MDEPPDIPSDDDSSTQPAFTPTPCTCGSSFNTQTRTSYGEGPSTSNSGYMQQEQMLAMVKTPTVQSEREAFAEWTKSVMLELEHDVWRRFQQEQSTLLMKYTAENDIV